MFKKPEDGRSTQEILLQIQELSRNYLGTKNYHNFTTKVEFSAENAKRYISKMDVEIFNSKSISSKHDDLNYLLFTIEGHGFMYHQIRKMIGLIIQAINKEFQTEQFDSFFLEKKIDIWLAPSAGLFLKDVIKVI